jgi:hypothetical protein
MLENLDITIDKNKLIRFAVLFGIFIVASVLIFFLAVNPLLGDDAKGLTYNVTLDVQTTVSDTLTLYYDNLDFSRYDEEHKRSANVKGKKGFQSVVFEVPAENISYLRFSLGTQSGTAFAIRSIKINSFSHEKTITYDKIGTVFDIVSKAGSFSNRDGYVYTKANRAGAYFANSKPIEVTNGRPTLAIISMSIALVLISGALFIIKMIKEGATEWFKTPEFVLFCLFILSLILVIVFGLFVSPSGSTDYIIKTVFFLLLFLACLVLAVFRFIKSGEKPAFTDIFTVVCLGIVICIPIITGVFFANELPADYTAPDFTLGRFLQYPEELTNNYQTQYPINSMLSSSYSEMKTFFFSDSRYDEVVIGKNNWLFSSEELVSYKRMNSYSKEDLIAIRNTLLNYEKVLNAQGIDLYVVIVPYKSAVYQHMMPPSIRRRSRAERLQQVYDYLWKYSDMNIVELRDALVSASYDKDMYFKTDNYMNSFGAFNSTNLLLMKMAANDESLEALDVESYDIETAETKFKSLAMIMGYGDSYEEYDYNFTKKRRQNIIVSTAAINPNSTGAEEAQPVYRDINKQFGEGAVEWMTDENLLYLTENYINTTNKNAVNNKHVVVVHDEALLTMMPFISEAFSEASFIYRDGDIVMRDILNEAPDSVVLEISEKYLSDLLGK